MPGPTIGAIGSGTFFTRRLHGLVLTNPEMDVRRVDECRNAVRAPVSACEHIHSLRNEKLLAPLSLGHLIKGIERNGLDEE